MTKIVLDVLGGKVNCVFCGIVGLEICMWGVLKKSRGEEGLKLGEHFEPSLLWLIS